MRPPSWRAPAYWRRLLTVTLPIMRPTLMINLLLITLGTISDFTLIFAMTQGGPGNQTAILPVYMYIEAFQFNQLGYGTAIALTLVLIGAILSIAYIRQLRPELQDSRHDPPGQLAERRLRCPLTRPSRPCPK